MELTSLAAFLLVPVLLAGGWSAILLHLTQRYSCLNKRLERSAASGLTLPNPFNDDVAQPTASFPREQAA